MHWETCVSSADDPLVLHITFLLRCMLTSDINLCKFQNMENIYASFSMHRRTNRMHTHLTTLLESVKNILLIVRKNTITIPTMVLIGSSDCKIPEIDNLISRCLCPILQFLKQYINEKLFTLPHPTPPHIHFLLRNTSSKSTQHKK